MLTQSEVCHLHKAEMQLLAQRAEPKWTVLISSPTHDRRKAIDT